MQPDSAQIKRLAWRSRRGLLELDLQLERFVCEQLPQLDEVSQSIYRDVLLLPDLDLLDYLNGKTLCPDPRLQSMIERIRQTALMGN